MKLMFDLNVVLDVIENRTPHVEYSSIVVSEVLYHNIEGILPGHGLTTIYYLIAKGKDTCIANQKIDWLLAHFDVVSADKALFVRARSLASNDFEDSVVAVLADVSGCDYIVTRNEPDFEHSPVLAITPEDFVKRYVFARHQENSE
jgi:hypothetical protein